MPNVAHFILSIDFVGDESQKSASILTKLIKYMENGKRDSE
jgi:hypothetical protein